MSTNANTKNSRLPAPKSGLKPPQIIVGNTVKRQIDAVSNSSSASGSIPKRQKTNVSNLTKVINPQIKTSLVPKRPLRASISNISLTTTSSSNEAKVTNSFLIYVILNFYIFQSSALSRSMVQIQRSKGGPATRLPPIANMTGRPSTIAGNYVGGRAKMNAPTSIHKAAIVSSRNAMSDRTNGYAKNLNDPTIDKVMPSCITITLFDA